MENDKKPVLGELQIHAEGRKYVTELTGQFLHRKKWQAPDPGLVRSAIPGTVLEVFVSAGDRVETGQPLLVYEAMKMHNVITAPFAGRVVSVEVRTGDSLPKDAVMLRIENGLS